LEKPDTPAPEFGEASGPFELEALRHFLKQSIEMSNMAQELKQKAIAQLTSFSTAEVKSLVLRMLQVASARPNELMNLVSKVRE
jgi:hypothetical protein